jgi:type II secretory pathway component GspD/PulD (secretin)
MVAERLLGTGFARNGGPVPAIDGTRTGALQPTEICVFLFTMMYFRFFLIFCVLTGTPLLAQQKAAAGSRNEEPMSSFQAVNASIDAILQQYEELTGNVLILDSNLAANALPISISVPEPVPRSELVRIIESALLLNNYALIRGTEPNTVKVINMNAGKNPRSEGLPLYASPAWPSRR